VPECQNLRNKLSTFAMKKKQTKPTSSSTTPPEPGSAALDRYDVRILHELQADGRLTNAELAERVGLSAAPCWRRVRRLESEGYILGYHAQIDRQKIGLGVIAFVRIYAERNTGEVTEQLKRALLKLPEVISCHHVSGQGTFEIEVIATSLDAYSLFVREVIINLPHVKDLHTSFSMGEFKNTRALPLGHLRGGA
jgi:Lrp/AsnC family transcriptional regulator, leucine-responsive regulatory protein